METEEGIEVNETKKSKKRKANADGENVKEKSGKKKAKARKKTRKVATKVTVGKKAADKVREKNKAKKRVPEEDNELDFEEEEVKEQEDDSNNNEEMKREEEVKIWTKGDWKVDPRVRRIPGAHVIDPSAHLLNENSFIKYFLTYFPVEYTKDVMLPATNMFTKEGGWQHKPFTYEEFIHSLGLLYMMEVVHLPER